MLVLFFKIGKNPAYVKSKSFQLSQFISNMRTAKVSLNCLVLVCHYGSVTFPEAFITDLQGHQLILIFSKSIIGTLEKGAKYV